MPKVKPEKITGIVAMSYLVLIPVGAAIFWRKLQIIDRDLTTVWDELKLPEQTETTRLINTNKVRKFLGL